LPRKSRTTASGRARSAVFVDSSGWIALVSARDSHHAEADALFRDLLSAHRSLVTSNLVIAEVHRLLLHWIGIAAARSFLERIEQSPSVEIVHADERHHRRALKWLDDRADQRLTYTDTTSFAIMQSRRIREALSFDHHFETAGFTCLRPA